METTGLRIILGLVSYIAIVTKILQLLVLYQEKLIDLSLATLKREQQIKVRMDLYLTIKLAKMPMVTMLSKRLSLNTVRLVPFPQIRVD